MIAYPFDPSPHETVGPGARCACGDDHTTGPDPFEVARAANTICSGHSCAICSGPEWWDAHECTARATPTTKSTP